MEARNSELEIEERRRAPEPLKRESPRGDLALVMTGGGARGAYQVGVLRAIARHLPDLRFDIITGVSAGAINAAFLSCYPGSFRESVDKLADLWRNLRTENVFRVGTTSLSRNVSRWALRLMSGSARVTPRPKGLVDTAPLDEFLRKLLCNNGNEIVGIKERLGRGELKAIALTTLNYSTGQTVTWVQGRGIELWERPSRRSVHAQLAIPHIMASAALPLIFPAIQLDGSWHGDGGVRLSAPLSPALHLGASRILAMSTRYQKTFDEADQPTAIGYPPPAQILGLLMNAIFLDVIDQDAVRLERLNQLLKKLPEESRDGMRIIDHMVMRPSIDLGQLSSQFEPQLPSTLRFLLRGLGTKETKSPDFLSLLMFQPDFLEQVLECGEHDAEERMDELVSLLSDDVKEQAPGPSRVQL